MSLLEQLLCVVIITIGYVAAATHDEIPQCGLTAIYKDRQSILHSPHYPANYPRNTCWDYLVRSPFRCPTMFHLQFLDFQLTSSPNCTWDYLAIGLDAGNGDDIDILCGEITGIKKYPTPNGILRLRFFSDEFQRPSGKGFELIITRLACQTYEPFGIVNKNTNEDEDEERNAAVTEPPDFLLPPMQNPPQSFYNVSALEKHNQFPIPPYMGWPKSPGSFESSIPNSINNGEVQRVHIPFQPTSNTNGIPDLNPSQFYIPTYHMYQQLPNLVDQYPRNMWEQRRPPGNVRFGQTQNTCCTSTFQQRRFYLSSPGFPDTAFTSLLPVQQRDCQFHLEKTNSNICRLRIHFKFFNFGQTSGGNLEDNVDDTIGGKCLDDFFEIDNERFCGCRSGYRVVAPWFQGNRKLLRLRMGYSNLPSNGFVLDIIQEECVRESSIFEQQLPHVYPLAQFSQQPQIQLRAAQPSFYSVQSLEPVNPSAISYWAQLAQPIRYSRSMLDIHRANDNDQPYRVVETNATRNEYYFFDGDADQSERRVRQLPAVPPNIDYYALPSAEFDRRCIYDMPDVLRLSTDVLWQMKPICYAPIGA